MEKEKVMSSCVYIYNKIILRRMDEEDYYKMKFLISWGEGI